MRIRKDLAVAVTTTAQDVDIQYRDFLIVNCGESVVYFRDKDLDGKDVTAETGFAVMPKSALPYPMTASVLSIIGEGDADVRLLFVDIV